MHASTFTPVQGLTRYLGTSDLLRARLVCKRWREGLSSAHLPACVILPVCEEQVKSTGHALLASAHTLVLAQDEVRLDGLYSTGVPALAGGGWQSLQLTAQHGEGNAPGHPAHAGVPAQSHTQPGMSVQGQLELLSTVCHACTGFRLLFKPAVLRMYHSEHHLLSLASTLWLSKVSH